MQDHTVLAAIIQGVLEAARSLGMDPAAIAKEAGLAPDWLDDPDGRVPVAADIALWTVLSREPVGVLIGERLGQAPLGLVGYAMRHGGTVGEAMAWLDRYRAVLHPDLVPRQERRREPAGERVVYSKPVYPVFARLREPVIAQAAGTVAVIRGISGQDVRARWVSLPLPRPQDPGPVERWFQCPVAWAAPLLEVAFDAAVLDLPLPKADPHLFDYLSRRAKALQADLPGTTHAARARREVGELLAKGDARLPVVAQRLGTSERTLHRRLAEEGTTFAELLDDERKERALLLLEDPRLSCSEVAFLLGYTETAPFFRAFKRWTGATPQAHRQAAKAARAQAGARGPTTVVERGTES
jgi:AraC-like DNA-binding protein